MQSTFSKIETTVAVYKGKQVLIRGYKMEFGREYYLVWHNRLLFFKQWVRAEKLTPPSKQEAK